MRTSVLSVGLMCVHTPTGDSIRAAAAAMPAPLAKMTTVGYLQQQFTHLVCSDNPCLVRVVSLPGWDPWRRSRLRNPCNTLLLFTLAWAQAHVQAGLPHQHMATQTLRASLRQGIPLDKGYRVGTFVPLSFVKVDGRS